jgi:hypothetical protein
VSEYDFVHAHSEREIVRRIFEKGISANVHFMKEHARKKRRQTKRLAISDEVDFVSARRESDPQLCRYRT